MDFLSKLKKGKGGKAAPEAEAAPEDNGYKRDPRKAESFFRHAQTTADSRNYDYSIKCYIDGLRHDPDNLERHEELHEVAKRRKVGGGKKPAMKEKLAKVGKTTVDKMLHQEFLWSKDPLEMETAMKAMGLAIEADKEYEDVHLSEFAYWLGCIILEYFKTAKKANFIKLCDLFVEVPAYDKAVECLRLALVDDPDDEQLISRLRDLEAERTLQEGHYGSGEEGGFRNVIRDADRQRELEEEDSLTKSDSVIDAMIQRRREAYEEDPENTDLLGKLIRALLSKDDEATENEAIELLSAAHARTGQYRFKLQTGDVRMKQWRRKQRAAQAARQANPSDPEAKKALQRIATERARFELAEYQDRAENYPTDMRIRFELGRRLFALGQFDEAIAEFQRAQGDPKHRAASHEFLGRCYTQRGYYDEAIDALRHGLEAHDSHDDKLAMDLRYLLMDALERMARERGDLDQAIEAQKTASQILQININFRDIRDRMDKLRALVAELRDKQKGAGD